jgi:metallophosphoesterase (TIGR00282 family)
MRFRILCVGDVVGKPGCRVLSQGLPALRKEHELDCVIVNVENAAGGSGLTENLYGKIRRYGADVMTMGDHVYRRAEIIPVLESSPCILRPANLPPEAPGKVMVVHEAESGPRVAVITLMGRLFMKPAVDCPYRTVDRLLESLDDNIRMIVVEMHAEATSEKISMGWHLDGRVSLVFGTHTHVTTADERILPQGTGYITDLGMTGPHDGVLGRDKDRVLKSFITATPTPFSVAKGDLRLNGIVATLDADTGRCLHIERVVYTLDETAPEPDTDDDRDSVVASGEHG